MVDLTTEQRIAKEKFILNFLSDQADISNANDSDAGDETAFALEEYHNMLGLEVLSDEVPVYDTCSGYPHILKRDEITPEIAKAIAEGELIVKQGSIDGIGYTEACDEIPACFDLQGNPCTPFSYNPADFFSYTEDDESWEDDDESRTYDKPWEENKPEPCNYKRHIDVDADYYNGFIAGRYLSNRVSDYIYTLAIAFAATSLEHHEYIDTDYVEEHIKSAIIGSIDPYDGEYEDFYEDMVKKAVSDTENMLYALRYKNMPDKGCSLSGNYYGGAFAIFANIFASSVFNPYVCDDDYTYDIFSII